LSVSITALKNSNPDIRIKGGNGIESLVTPMQYALFLEKL